LWLAGIVPGLIGALFIAIVAVVIGRRYETARPASALRPKVDWLRTLPAALIPVVVIGGIRTGLLTVSETASILVAYVVIYGFVSRRLNGRKLLLAFQRGGRRCALIFLILIAARTFTFFVIQRELAPELLSWVTSVQLAHWLLLAILNVFLLLLGTMMDGLSLLIIATPLIYPVVTQLGMSPLQLAIMLGVNIEVAVVHPPFGMNLFAVAGVTGTSITQISWRVLPFIGVLLSLLALVTYAPLPIFLWNAHQ
jgi:C4-dicarboxylate transporter DctM subunit